MYFEELKSKIQQLAQKHNAINEEDISEFKDAELLEHEAEHLIIAYCENQKYLINGFPTEKKAMADVLEEDYFSRERYQYYLDSLLIEKEDVADLMWCYISGFWPDYFETKDEYIATIKEQLNSDFFYEINNF
ncbi:hypothetical protein [Flavobacterium sp.]|jgi:hypothetical protein|uniref:hypothetical protein n=1 Tax=Flavobacterium sp. TaxID=239 RepID=UPI0035B3595D